MIWFFWTKPVQVSRAIRYYRIQSHPLTHFHNLFYGYERGFYYFLFKQSLKTFSLWHVKAWGGKDRGGKIQISGGTIYLCIVQKKIFHGLHQKTNNWKMRYIIYRDKVFPLYLHTKEAIFMKKQRGNQWTQRNPMREMRAHAELQSQYLELGIKPPPC